MKKAFFIALIFAFFGMLNFTSCKQQAKEAEATEEIIPTEEAAPAEEAIEEAADTLQAAE